MIVANNNIIYK